MHLWELQEALPWGLKTYSKKFKAYRVPHRDFQHALVHLAKASGKLWTMVEEADHKQPPGFDPFPKADVEKYVADLVVCAIRMANTNPSGAFDLSAAVAARMDAKRESR